uniref:Shieldin complex subunit 1 n=1 Tax=Salvator merianae TaxID=96440 RepID=A0A8D0EBA1_SALMN
MEESEAPSSSQSEESSVLDMPCVMSAESFLPNPRVERCGKLLSPPDTFLSSGSTAPDTDSGNAFFTGHIAISPMLREITQELFDPSTVSSSGTSEQKDEGELTIRKSLNKFYETFCRKKPYPRSPTYEAASQCLSGKIAELEGREGTRYAQKSLQIAQMVLNRDENKIFPEHTSATNFSSNVCLKNGKQLPGLSDDILQFILKQNVTQT